MSEKVVTCTLENVRQQTVPIIIFGAGINGQVLLNLLRTSQVHVDCFCDNDPHKVGTTILGCTVHHPSYIKEKYANAFFIIATSEIADVVIQLSNYGFSEWCAGGNLLKEVDLSAYHFDVPSDYSEFVVSSCILCHERFTSPDKIFLRSVDIVITEQCTLKCKDCSNLMQYYASPQRYGADHILEAIDIFVSLVDEVNEFRVIGGEPFINKEIHLILKRLVSEPKVNKVVIYTNGTIIPDKKNLDALIHPKILVLITDYGPLSRKIDALKDVLNNIGASFLASKPRNWTDCATIEQHNRTIKEQETVFKNCCVKNLFTILNGRFYRCPFSAHVDRLKAVPNFNDDHVDLIREQIRGEDSAVLRKEMKDFIGGKSFLNSCDYCSGRSFGDPEIVPAVQVNKPLHYQVRTQ